MTQNTFVVYHGATVRADDVTEQENIGQAKSSTVTKMDILDMAHRDKDPNRLKDGDKRLADAMEAANYLVDQRGTRNAAALLGWSGADINRIANGKWKEIRMYPETVEALLFAQAVVSHDESLIGPLRDELKEFSREVGAVVRRASHIRKMIKTITR